MNGTPLIFPVKSAGGPVLIKEMVREFIVEGRREREGRIRGRGTTKLRG